MKVFNRFSIEKIYGVSSSQFFSKCDNEAVSLDSSSLAFQLQDRCSFLSSFLDLFMMILRRSSDCPWRIFDVWIMPTAFGLLWSCLFSADRLWCNKTTPLVWISMLSLFQLRSYCQTYQVSSSFTDESLQSFIDWKYLWSILLCSFVFQSAITKPSSFV